MRVIPDLTRRRLEPEWMDDPDIDPILHQQALRGLARINRISRSDAILWPSIHDYAKTATQPVRVLDVACGGGDVLIKLARRAQRAGLDLELHGCDRSSIAIENAAQLAHQANVRLTLHHLDALSEPLPGGMDVATTCLFLHHLTREQTVALLGRMRVCARLVVINDLERSRRGYLAARLGTRLLSRSPVVHQDGPQSVQASWTITELKELAREAGLEHVTTNRCWPFRIRMVWRENGT